MTIETSRPRTEQQSAALSIYLNDHLAAATGGVELARRAAAAEQGSPLGAPLRALAGDLEADRRALTELMARLGVGVTSYKLAGAWLAEKAGRLKPNGGWLHRSALAPVVETEGLRLVAEHGAAAWRTLRALAGSDIRLDAAELDRLVDRAAEQAAVAGRLAAESAAHAFGGPVG